MEALPTDELFHISDGLDFALLIRASLEILHQLLYICTDLAKVSRKILSQKITGRGIQQRDNELTTNHVGTVN